MEDKPVIINNLILKIHKIKHDSMEMEMTKEEGKEGTKKLEVRI